MISHGTPTVYRVAAQPAPCSPATAAASAEPAYAARMADERWFWCMRHGRAEPESEACRMWDRLGPYGTRDEAEHWRERVEQRNAAWEAEDPRWEGDD